MIDAPPPPPHPPTSLSLFSLSHAPSTPAPLSPPLFPSLSPPLTHDSIPDGAARCRSEWGFVKQTWARRADLPSGEAGMYALFAGELFAWACVGEIVGRGFTFGGYAV